jgi:hypothetical protein
MALVTRTTLVQGHVPGARTAGYAWAAGPLSSTAPRDRQLSEVIGEAVGGATVSSRQPPDGPRRSTALAGDRRPGAAYRLAIELDDGSGTMGHLGTERTLWEWPVEADADEVASISLRD